MRLVLVVVAVAFMLDRIIGDAGIIRTITIYCFVANEGISLIENWVGMGLPLPKIISDTLLQLKEKNK